MKIKDFPYGEVLFIGPKLAAVRVDKSDSGKCIFQVKNTLYASFDLPEPKNPFVRGQKHGSANYSDSDIRLMLTTSKQNNWWTEKNEFENPDNRSYFIGVTPLKCSFFPTVLNEIIPISYTSEIVGKEKIKLFGKEVVLKDDLVLPEADAETGELEDDIDKNLMYTTMLRNAADNHCIIKNNGFGSWSTMKRLPKDRCGEIRPIFRLREDAEIEDVTNNCDDIVISFKRNVYLNDYHLKNVRRNTMQNFSDTPKIYRIKEIEKDLNIGDISSLLMQ